MTAERQPFSRVGRWSRGIERRRAPGLLAAGAVILISACSGTLVPIDPTPGPPTLKPATPSKAPAAPSATSTSTSTSAAEASTAPAEGSPSGAPVATTVELAIGTAAGRAEFSYVPTTLTAPAGSRIKLKLSNMTNPDDEIGHNWVLVIPGKEDSVLASATVAGDDGDWLDKGDPGIIAATQLIEGGAHDTVTFKAPEPGTYTFLCTFPKHYAGGMKGTLTIQ